MKAGVTQGLLAGMISLWLSGCSQLEGPAAAHEWGPDTLMVVIDDPRSSRARSTQSGPGYAARLGYADDPALKRRVDALTRDYRLTVFTQWPVKNLHVHCFLIAKPDPATLRQLQQDNRVRWVQPFNEFAVRSTAGLPAAGAASRVARFAELHPARGAGIKLAVVDTSVDQSHMDLETSMVSQRDFVGVDAAAGEAHGTAVVGLIAANPSSANGVQGLASNADVQVLRACWQTTSAPGKCNTLTLALALDAAIDLQPDVLNLSLTGGYDRILQALIERLTAAGTLVVAAYDEQRAPAKRFPAPVPGLIYAYGHGGLTRNNGGDAEVVVMNNQAIIAAPREAFTLAPHNGYDIVSGHSIAAPQVSAAAACLMHEHPGSSILEIQHMLVKWMNGAN